MKINPNAHGLCPWVASAGGHPKTLKIKRIIMKTNYEFPLKYKSDYLELSDKISKLRNHGEEIPLDLLLQALMTGCLAEIPSGDLDSLLFNVDNQ